MQRTRASYVLGVAVSLLAVACGSQTGELLTADDAQEQSIINGTPSTPGEFPSAGVLLVNGGSRLFPKYRMFCSGTLIAPDVVLTAGHCVGDDEYYFSFTDDVTDLDKHGKQLPEHSIAIRKMVRHPDFAIPRADGLGKANDVAVAFLDEAVTDVTPVAVLKPSEADLLKVGASTMIVGYGMLTPPEVDRWKHDVGVKRQAKSVINEVDDYEIQVGEKAPMPQKCYGDSGGPSYIDTDDGLRLIGITSRAYDRAGCTKGGIDSRGDAFRAWMVEALEEGCSDGTRLSDCPTLL